MQYITGRVAFGVYDETSESCGIWNIRKHEFLDEEALKCRNSEESVFGDWGIQKDVMLPYHEFCTFNVAGHIRAYCDMLEMGKAADMRGLFAEAIDSAKCRMDIFMLVYGKMREHPQYPFIDAFFKEEFGNAWESYKKSVKKNADFLNSSVIDFQRAVESKKEYEKTHKSKYYNPSDDYLEG